MTLEIRAATIKQGEKKIHRMLLLGLLMKVRELNALFESKKCTLYFPYEQPVFKGDHATPFGIRRQCYFHDY